MCSSDLQPKKVMFSPLAQVKSFASLTVKLNPSSEPGAAEFHPEGISPVRKDGFSCKKPPLGGFLLSCATEKDANDQRTVFSKMLFASAKSYLTSSLFTFTSYLSQRRVKSE